VRWFLGMSAPDQFQRLEQVKYHTLRKLLYASEASSTFPNNQFYNIGGPDLV